MSVFEIGDDSSLKDIVLEHLKVMGVRCRLPKKTKDDKIGNFTEIQTFQKPLNLLKKTTSTRINGSVIEIPEFLVDVCNIIENNITTEGIFRKAGSTCKQRESKLELNNGKKINCNYHVVDACNLVKLFFRELPQPLLPYVTHEIFLKCLLLPSTEKQVEALLSSCLLIPLEHIATLSYFMELLLKVSQHAEHNKMDIKNLAIILTPSLMPVSEQARSTNNLKLTHHFKVIELLIEHAQHIGILPERIRDSLNLNNRRSKKKRRSASLTRMFSGLKKIVGNRASSTPEWDEHEPQTPSSQSSGRKRKAAEGSGVGLSSKKKKQVTELLPDKSLIGTPLRCRMNGYRVTPVSSIVPMPANLKRIRSRSPPRGQRKLFTRSSTESFRDPPDDKKKLSLGRRRTIKKQKSMTQLSVGAGPSQKKSLERRLSIISWGKRKSSLSNLFLNKSAPNYDGEAIEMQCFKSPVDLSASETEPDAETITVPKKEYEDIQKRLSALEDCISDGRFLQNMTQVESVQDIYEKTLEESDRISADNLAGRLSKELKIRRSFEGGKVIRSPSARKIGSIRRRSKELIQKTSEKITRSESMEVKSTLKRGRPNTLLTGLPSPGSLRAASSMDLTVEPTEVEVRVKRASSFQEPMETDAWHSGDAFFSHARLAQRLLPVAQGRPSLAELRNQNAGMVLQKARLFNSFNQSEEEGERKKPPRRQSVRLEEQRRNSETKSPKKIGAVRTKSRNGKKREMNFPETKENKTLEKPQITQDLKETIYQVCTPISEKAQSPLRETNRLVNPPGLQTPKNIPSIKKSLGTRSPRQIGKTPLSELRSRPRATPLRALLDPQGTPRRTPRRSPRILARSTLSRN